MGRSAVAEAFGASVTVEQDERGLYLVVGQGVSPAGVVESVGGDVVLRLPDGRRLLAIMPNRAHEAVRRHPLIALAGRVAIDHERFNRFAALVGLDREHGPAG
jgi:hypothetical protein